MDDYQQVDYVIEKEGENKRKNTLFFPLLLIVLTDSLVFRQE